MVRLTPSAPGLPGHSAACATPIRKGSNRTEAMERRKPNCKPTCKPTWMQTLLLANFRPERVPSYSSSRQAFEGQRTTREPLKPNSIERQINGTLTQPLAHDKSRL